MASKKTLTAPQENQLYGNKPEEPGIYGYDDWTQFDEKPTKLYQLDFYNGQDDITSPQSSYFIDENTYNAYLKKDDDGNLIQDKNGNNVFDVQKYCNDAQIAPYVVPVLDEDGNPVLDKNGEPVYEASYKNHISCYDVSNDDLEMWEGTANANDQYGTGGAKQFYVPEEDFSKLTKNDSFVSPTIPEEDRHVDPTQALDAIDKGKQKNKELRNELAPTPMEEEAANADKIAATPQGKEEEKPTIKQVADESNLPKTEPIEENTLGLNQSSEPTGEKTTMNQVANENSLPKTEPKLDNSLEQNQNITQ